MINAGATSMTTIIICATAMISATTETSVIRLGIKKFLTALFKYDIMVKNVFTKEEMLWN